MCKYRWLQQKQKSVPFSIRYWLGGENIPSKQIYTEKLREAANIKLKTLIWYFFSLLFLHSLNFKMYTLHSTHIYI